MCFHKKWAKKGRNHVRTWKGVEMKKDAITRRHTCVDQEMAFHTGACTRMTVCMAWILSQIVYQNNFYKGDHTKMWTEGCRAKSEHNHLHPLSQTLVASISISLAPITTIDHLPLVHTCNRASHKATIVRHICNQSIFKMCSIFFSIMI